MAVLTALLLGLGVLLVYDALTSPVREPLPRTGGVTARLRTALVHAEVATTPSRFVAACGAAGAGAALVALVAVGSAVVALVALVAGCAAPVVAIRRRARATRRRRRDAWPEAVELLAAAVRAGETLPAALALVAERGPAPLQPAFRGAVADHRITGDLRGALDALATRLADPVADRVALTLGTAARVGGSDLGRVLRTLAGNVREDITERRELEARQSWTVVAARVAAAAPWVVLLLVASRPQGRAAYDSAAGAAVVLAGAATTLVGYRVMVAVGRLPEEPRVLRREVP